MLMKIVLVTSMTLWNVTTKEKVSSPKANLVKEVFQLKTQTSNPVETNPSRTKLYYQDQELHLKNLETVENLKKKENKTNFTNC